MGPSIEFKEQADELERQNKIFVKRFTNGTIKPEDLLPGELFLKSLTEHDMEPTSLLHHADQLIKTTKQSGVINHENVEHISGLADKIRYAVTENVSSAEINIERANFSFRFGQT